ncbi:MAG: signal peptidase I [Candidatus Liptonbacteria bacterium]|nr:signal peptidase I [Candidatus Liptonbacteria bacterium]
MTPSKKTGREGLSRLLQNIAVAVTVALIFSQLYSPRKINGLSMFPAIENDDRIFICTLACSNRPLQRGDIVVIKPPHQDDGREFVKRIVGLPGEMIEIKNGRAIVNGSQLAEPYAYFDFPYGRDWRDAIPLRLGDGKYFVMGDNRNNSNDSRVFGAIEGKDIRGVVAVFYWPPEKFLKKPALPYR